MTNAIYFYLGGYVAALIQSITMVILVSESEPKFKERLKHCLLCCIASIGWPYSLFKFTQHSDKKIKETIEDYARAEGIVYKTYNKSSLEVYNQILSEEKNA